VAVEAGAEVVALVGAVDQEEWVAHRPQDQVATVSAPVVGSAKRTWWACPAIRKSARNAARKWRVNDETETGIKRRLCFPCGNLA
jgi:hypothetical protein